VDESLRQAPPADTWRETFGQTIDVERRRATQRVDDHRQRLRDLDSRISAQLGEAVAALTRDQEQAHQSTAGAQAKTAALEERQKLLDDRQKQLDARQAELDKQQADLASNKGSEPDRLKDLKRREVELTTARQAHEAEQAKLNAQRESLRELESNLKLKEQTLGTREQQTKRQRQIVARQLRARKSELAAEAAQEEIGRHASELEKVHRESKQQIEQLRADFTTARANELKAVNQQLEDLKTKLTEAEAGLQRARQECDQERAACRNSDSTIQSTIVELTKLRDENKQLTARLTDAEKRAKDGGSGGSGGGQEMEDLKRRFEMAVQDVRELKTKNVELTEQLAKAQHSPKAAAAVAGGGGNDWESMKKKLLAEMDSDFDESNEQQKAGKLTVENAIKITDDVVAEKDREIEELRRTLESQSQQVGEVAVGAAAVAQMLDTDELVKQEREALKRLQDQLREQLRQAELDISVERARLGREKSELEEKARSFEAEKASLGPAGGAGDAKGNKSRKWLTRLGLGEGEK